MSMTLVGFVWTACPTAGVITRVPLGPTAKSLTGHDLELGFTGRFVSVILCRARVSWRDGGTV